MAENSAIKYFPNWDLVVVEIMRLFSCNAQMLGC